MKNIFLTGEVGVGKSTVLRKVLDMLPPMVCGGFLTVSAKAITTGALLDVFIEKAWAKTPHNKAHLVGSRLGQGRFIPYPEVFDTVGTKILSELPPDAKIIIMDELGVMESDAAIFTNAVLHMLDGPLPILGVIKTKQSVFLNEIRQHSRSEIYEVTDKNRDALPFHIKDRLISCQGGVFNA